ncbi:hypothetical protein [Campylobacter lanienae]|uniref:hypothetical protein n=1 Tax=Campylobacter lanienae TaxID=75658 RepID=UPI000BB42029|nr:hypothetical protein [Campylobacter lanienae]
MLLNGVERKEFSNLLCNSAGRGTKMFDGGGRYRICGVVSSNYTWPTYNQKRCYFTDDVNVLHILIDTGRTGSAYGNNVSWAIDVTLQAQGALYFWGAYHTSPNGWKFNGFVERVG